MKHRTTRMPFYLGHLAIAACILVGLLLAPLVYAEDDFCDPYLPTSDSPHGYKMRGSRCEGIYQQEVSGSSNTLVILSFTGTFEDYDPANLDELKLRWPSVPDKFVWARARGIKRKLYYGMDTRIDSTAEVFHWPGAILQARSIRRNHIGVTAWTRRKIGQHDRKVYLPLTISTSPQVTPDPDKPYRLLIAPRYEVKEIYLSLALVAADGTERAVYTDRPLEEGYYSRRQVVLDLPRANDAGLYKLEIIGESPQGARTSRTLWFQHGTT